MLMMDELILSLAVENSCLDVLFKSTASLDAHEVLFLQNLAPYLFNSLFFLNILNHTFQRAMFLEKDNAMARAHSLAASAGSTEVPVSLHV
jgi:ubiquitin carboxyl-terminal hydrolase L3